MPRSGQDRRRTGLDFRAGIAAASRPSRRWFLAASAVLALAGVVGSQAQEAGKRSPSLPPPREAAVEAAPLVPAPEPSKSAPKGTVAGDLPRLPDAPPAAAPSPVPAPAVPPAQAPAAAGAPVVPPTAAAPAPPAQGTEPAKAAPAAPAPPSASAVKLEGTGLLLIEEAAALRAEAEERLKALAAPEGAAVDPAAKLAAKAMQDVLGERKQRLDDYDKVVNEIQELSNPEANPDRQLAEAKAEAERMKAQMAQPIDDLLPSVFTQKGNIDEAGRSQMKEAIEGVKNDMKEFQDKLESTTAEAAKDAKGPLTALRADRDKTTQRIAALKARAEANASGPAAKTAADRAVGDERVVNLRIETTVETLRLQSVELKIARAGKAAETAELTRKNWIAHVQFGRKLLERMQTQYRLLAEADERELKRKADTEEAKAKLARDPLERYRAGRQAELLELEAWAVNTEQELAASPKPSLEDQRGLANKAANEFEIIKGMLSREGRLSRLDAIRLNTDYRRIGPERDRLRRDELAKVEKQMNDYADALATVELELIEDSMVDRVELENLLDKLPPERHDQAEQLVQGLEVRHKELLTRRRDALKKLSERALETLDQVNRRLAILDDEYSYIRTQIFWVRDQEPISASTFSRGALEFKRLIKVSIGLAQETANPKAWKTRLTPEFFGLGVVALVLPLGILRLRGVLKRQLLLTMPPSPPPPSPPPSPSLGDSGKSAVKVDMNPVVQ